MNREIKFRAFFENEIYYTGFHVSSQGIFWAWKDYTCKDSKQLDAPVMQFTGLKDKNGVDIYEGDIVRILYTDWMSKSDSDIRTLEQYLIDISHIGTIEYYGVEFCVNINGGYNSMFTGKYGFIEVIGNIHENPELL